MNKYDRFYDEACDEARQVINGWMSEKLRSELEADDPGGRWHEDSDAFVERFLSGPSHMKKQEEKPEIDIYNEDEYVAVNHLLTNMQQKLASTSLREYESKEKKKKPVQPKDPRIAMEVRQQKVKEARIRREEQMKQRVTRNIHKKQSDALAREIIKQETQEKAHQQKLEEEAIQTEMAKIRKRMLDLKKQSVVKVESKVEITENNPNTIENLKAQSSTPSAVSSIHCVKTHEKETLSEIMLRRNNIKKFESCQKQKLVRKCFQSWMKTVLATRAAIGKAKALADWHLIVKTWSAWRKYYFEEAAERDAETHQEHVKQMKVHSHIAAVKHRRFMLRKFFNSWKKFVKTEQFSKELLKEQESTKLKMEALLGAVSTKVQSTKNDLVLEAVEDDDDLFRGEEQESLQDFKPKSTKTTNSATAKHSTPKHAWQVRRTDVQKLTLKQIENMAGDSPRSRDTTKIKSLRPEGSKHKSSFANRVEASKTVIAQQREMIGQQKRIIEEQKRRLEEKASSHDEEEACDANDKSTVVTTMSERSSSSKSRLFQPPKRPKSLLAMEKRAEERMKRREEMQERKRQLERERIEEMQREEDERQRQEEEAKRKKIEEIKRLKQLEIEKERARRAFVAHMQQLRVKAEQHHRYSVLRKYGLKPWKCLMENIRSKMEIARFHHNSTLSRKVVVSWHIHVREDKLAKQAEADNCCKRLLLRRCFSNWLKYGETMTILERKAEIHNHRLLKITFLRRWERYVTDERLAYFGKEEIAVRHNRVRLKRRVFNIIFKYKQNLKREEERSKRLADMRKKVAQLLPDFNPSSSQD